MNREQSKKTIVEIVESVQGCKITELICHEKMESVIASSSDDIVVLIDELIGEEKLVGVEYVLSQMPYRVKQFLLPAGVEVFLLPPGTKVDIEAIKDRVKK